MNLIPHSNGVNKPKNKNNIRPYKILKWIACTLVVILVSALVFQVIVGKIYGEKYKARTKYARINEKRVYYNSTGSGDMTVILDGDIGIDFSEWNNIVRDVADKYNVNVVVYNRNGYGFSDGVDANDPKKQGDDLKLLLTKAGLNGPYVLVGSGYGSLVMTNFANSYKDSVKGMVLVDPLVESNLNNSEYVSKYTSIKKSSKIESIGSYFGVDYIRYKMGKLNVPEEVFNDQEGLEKNEFVSNRIRSKFSTAMNIEAKNVVSANSSSQKEGLIGDEPLVVVSRDSNAELDKSLLNLSTSKYINQIVAEKNGEFLPISDKNKVIEGIKFVIDKSRLKKRLN